MTAAGAQGCYHLSAIDPFAHFLIERLVLTVKAHVPVTMVDDQQQTETTQPVRESHPALGYRPDLSAFRRLDEHPLPLQAAAAARLPNRPASRPRAGQRKRPFSCRKVAVDWRPREYPPAAPAANNQCLELLFILLQLSEFAALAVKRLVSSASDAWRC